MNKQTEALKMAIEAMEDLDAGHPICTSDLLQACKEALLVPTDTEQPAQEYLTRAQQVIRANNSAQEPKSLGDFDKLSKAECVDYIEYLRKEIDLLRFDSWQGLSDDDMSIIFDKFDWKEVEIAGEHLDLFAFARAIEQALKEKNG